MLFVLMFISRMFDKENDMAKKYTDTTYVQDGIKFTQCAYRGPRSTERTFAPNRGSIAQMGAKAANLMAQGIKKGKA